MKTFETEASTIGELIEFLSQFPKDHLIAIPAIDGACRINIQLEYGNISTILCSTGPEVEW